MRFDIRHFKWWWQRRTRGFDDRELWSLDFTIAKFIYPRMKAFSEIKNGTPVISSKESPLGTVPVTMSSEEWQETLDKITKGFKTLSTEDGMFFRSDEDDPAVNESLDLFRKWFFNFWW